MPPPRRWPRPSSVAIPVEVYPHLHRMASHAAQTGYDAETDFDFGLEIVLDGLERILDASRAEQDRDRVRPPTPPSP